MKIKILFTVIFSLFFSQIFAAEIVNKDLKLEVKTSQEDDREDLQKIDFTKLLESAEKLYKDAKAWEKIKCEPKSGFLCTKHECKERPAKHYLILDKKQQTATRCEGNECEIIDAEFEQTGVFYNIQAKGPVGVLIRVLGDYRYKEISTVALDAYIANGECVVVND
jgi:hypothetical protein